MRVDWADPRQRLWLLGASLALGVAVLLLGRSWLGERLLPDPRMTSRIEQANAALRAGRLSAADGSGARELFESVLAVDPDQMQAREGLLAVRTAAVLRVREALATHRLQEAQRQLELARALSAPQVELEPLQVRLVELRAASADVSGLLAKAAAPGLDEESVLSLYRRVLAIDADNAAAIEGRERLLAARLQRAHSALEAGRVREAQTLVDGVLAEDPAHLDLPPARPALGEALSALQARQAAVLARAAADERRGRWDRAAARYQRLLEEDAALAGPREGLQRLATLAAQRAQRQAADFQFTRSEASLAKAKRWSPDAPQVAVAERSLARSRQARARLRQGGGDRARIPALVADAEAAIERGDYTTPPGASAWDRLRMIAAIDPSSKELARVEREFSAATRRCFEQALDAGKLNRAQACLDARVLQDAGSVTEPARAALAERWLAYADERIGAGDWSEAERALANARRWQPANAGVKAAETRLRTARRSAPAR